VCAKVVSNGIPRMLEVLLCLLSHSISELGLKFEWYSRETVLKHL
jgi:hypothetical protein